MTITVTIRSRTGDPVHCVTATSDAGTTYHRFAVWNDAAALYVSNTHGGRRIGRLLY